MLAPTAQCDLASKQQYDISYAKYAYLPSCCELDEKAEPLVCSKDKHYRQQLAWMCPKVTNQHIYISNWYVMLNSLK